MGGCGPERCTATTRNERMEEKSRKQGRVEARFEGGQGPEGAVAPYMDGWKGHPVTSHKYTEGEYRYSSTHV